jgi:hypothetical protein
MKSCKAAFLITIILLCAGSVAAQVVRRQERPQPATLCGKVAVIDLHLMKRDGTGVLPHLVIIGQQYKLKMTMRNCTQSNLSDVPFTIDKNGEQWQFSFVNLPAGGTQSVEVNWVAQEGRQRFVGRIDPWTQLNESTGERIDNAKTLDVSPVGVRVTIPGQVLVPLETQELDYLKAKNTGAGFNQGVSEGLNVCVRIGVDDSQGSHGYETGQPGVVFMAECPALLGVVGTGGSANPEAFQNFRLQNGWKVKSFSVRFSTNKEDQSDWHDSLSDAQSNDERRRAMQSFSLDIPPSVGTDNPQMKAHIGVKPGGFLKVYVKVIIEGPAGTDPYGAQGNPCGSGYTQLRTSSGEARCVSQSDVDNCSGGYSCVNNSDCALGNVCVDTRCGKRCVREKPPIP